MAPPRRRPPYLAASPFRRSLSICFGCASLAAVLLVAALLSAHDGLRPLQPLAMVKSRLKWPVGPKLPSPKKLRILRENAARVPKHLPRDGRALGPSKSSIAVLDGDRLAAEPLQLNVDRSGKTLKENETVQGSVSFATKDTTGSLSAATAPLSSEEFAARYQHMDKTMEQWLGLKSLAKLRGDFAQEAGLDDYRAVRTFAWTGSQDGAHASMVLIGVTSTSARSRRLAARAVYEAAPSGLLVQLCREKVGRYLIMPEEHLATVAHYARGYAAGNPHKLRQVIWACDAINGDWEAMNLWMNDLAYASAVDEFTQLPDNGPVPKTLCLGDVHHSRLEDLRKHSGNRSMRELPALNARGKQVARGLASLAEMGHRKIVGVVNVELLPTVTTWLERAGARSVAVADASDIEEGRETIDGDMNLGLVAAKKQVGVGGGSKGPVDRVLSFGQSRLGAFLNQDALDFIQRRKERLKKVTRVKDVVAHIEPPKVWKVAELLGGVATSSGGEELPGPGSRLPGTPKKGLRFEWEHLEIPDHYMRDVGMEEYAPELWRMLQDRGVVLETRDFMELKWWTSNQAAGGVPTPGETWQRGSIEDAEVLSEVMSSSGSDGWELEG